MTPGLRLARLDAAVDRLLAATDRETYREMRAELERHRAAARARRAEDDTHEVEVPRGR